MAGTTQGSFLTWLQQPIVSDARPQDQLDFQLRLWGVPPIAGCSPTVYALLTTIAAGSGGGGGSATAANQTTEITRLTTIRDYLGNPADYAYSSFAQLQASMNAHLSTIETGTNHLASIDNYVIANNTALGQINVNTSNISLTLSGTTNPLLTDIKTNGTNSNTKLDTLHADNVVIEGKIDLTNTRLGILDTDLVNNGNLITSSNTKLDTLHTDIGTSNTLSTTTNTKLDTLHTDNTGMGVQLDTLHTDNVTTQGKIDSTNTKLDTLHTDNTSLATSITETFITGQGSQTALNNNILLAVAGTGWLDTLGYDTIVLQIVPAAGTVTAGVISFEESNDTVNAVSTKAIDINFTISSQTFGSYSLVAATPRSFTLPCAQRYVRVRISTGITGTTTGVQCFSLLKKTHALTSVYTQLSGITPANGTANAVAQTAVNFDMLFNGTTWDINKNNYSETIFTSASRAPGANNSADFINYNAKGISFYVDITAVAASTVTVKVQVKDSISGNYIDVPGASTAALAATGTNRLVVYPGITASANTAVSDVIGRTYRLVATVSVANVTFSVSANYIN